MKKNKIDFDQNSIFLEWIFLIIISIRDLIKIENANDFDKIEIRHWKTQHWRLVFDISINVGYIEVSNLNATFGRKVRDHQWIDLVKHYWAILLVVLVAALIIALMPIIGWVCGLISNFVFFVRNLIAMHFKFELM